MTQRPRDAFPEFLLDHLLSAYVGPSHIWSLDEDLAHGRWSHRLEDGEDIVKLEHRLCRPV